MQSPVKQIEFQNRRKLHYNEFEAVKLARKLIEEDEDEDEDDKTNDDDTEIGESSKTNDQQKIPEKMEVEGKPAAL